MEKEGGERRREAEGRGRGRIGGKERRGEEQREK